MDAHHYSKRVVPYASEATYILEQLHPDWSTSDALNIRRKFGFYFDVCLAGSLPLPPSLSIVRSFASTADVEAIRGTKDRGQRGVPIVRGLGTIGH